MESVMAMWGREVVEKAFFVDPDIAKAETLPSYAFEDPDVLSLELSTLFAKDMASCSREDRY